MMGWGRAPGQYVRTGMSRRICLSFVSSLVPNRASDMSDSRVPFVLSAQDGRVVTLTLNSPGTRNAIGTQQDCEDIVGALERAEADPQVPGPRSRPAAISRA